MLYNQVPMLAPPPAATQITMMRLGFTTTKPTPERACPAAACWLSNQTWIFEIDKEDVVDNMGDSVKIYILDDNLYMLVDEIKDAILYNILGQKVVAVSGDRLDITPLPLGVYFLRYVDGKGEKVAKVVKR